MSALELLALNESTPQGGAPQVGDTALLPITLQHASANEIALDMNVTVNKVGGNDTLLRLNQIPTAAPGTSLILDLAVNGTSVLTADDSGNLDLIGGNILNPGTGHDAFSDFVAAEHVDWAAESAGTIHATNYASDPPTVADEAADTTCFIGFYTAATGALPPKSNAALAFNSALDAGSLGIGAGSLLSADTGGGALRNVALGPGTLASCQFADDCVAIGYNALNAQINNAQCTAVGSQALEVNTAHNNTAMGFLALWKNTSGTENVAIGPECLQQNITGNQNTAVGHRAGQTQAGATDDNNTWMGHDCGRYATGSASGGNTGVGSLCLDALLTGIDNTCMGFNAGGALTTASGLVAIGAGALALATDNERCTAVGFNALAALVSGGLEATAVGSSALAALTTGDRNVGLGNEAGKNINTGSGNVLVGADTGWGLTSKGSNAGVGDLALGLANCSNSTALGTRAGYLNTATGTVAVGFYSLSTNAAALRVTAVGYQSGTAQAGAGDDDNTWIGYNCGAVANGSASGGNTGVGSLCLDALLTGIDNTCVGFNAGGALTTSSSSTIMGAGAGAAATDTFAVTAFGFEALAALASGGNFNAAFGYKALNAITTGDQNVAVGYEAMKGDGGSTTVTDTVAVGFAALKVNRASDNTAMGSEALFTNSAGINNTATGSNAGKSQAGAGDDNNSWFGKDAGLLANGSASGGNTAVGSQAMDQLTTGIDNIGIGLNACSIVTTGSQNVMVGNDTATSATGSLNQICIGDTVVATADDQASIGKSGAITSNDFGTDAVWTNTSDERKKRNILPSLLGLDFINALRPKTFQFRPATEWPDEWGVKPGTTVNTEKVMHGLVAQDVRQALDAAGVDDFAGWKQTPTGEQQIGKSMFVFPLIKAVQELTEKIFDLESRLEAAGA